MKYVDQGTGADKDKNNVKYEIECTRRIRGGPDTQVDFGMKSDI